MSLLSRIIKLEKEMQKGQHKGGEVYFVIDDNGVFCVPDHGKNLEMTETEFAAWENSKGANDVIYTITKQEFDQVVRGEYNHD